MAPSLEADESQDQNLARVLEILDRNLRFFPWVGDPKRFRVKKLTQASQRRYCGAINRSKNLGIMYSFVSKGVSPWPY